MSGQTKEDISTTSNKRQLDAPQKEAKKQKTSEDDAPLPTFSKTLHARNLPPDTTEQDLIGIALPFGRVVNVLLLKGKNQALIQMEDIQCTAALTQYYNSTRASIRGKQIYFQYSNREEITAGQQGPEQQNHVLLVTVLNVVFNVDIDVLFSVFSKYGTILKIVIFQKSAGLQSLVQFSDVSSAVNAKMELDGQNIYSGCCTLRIQYSSLSNLNVKYNNEKSRDYSNPNLPTTPSTNTFVPIPLLAATSTLYSPTWLNQTNPPSPPAYPPYPYLTAALNKSVASSISSTTSSSSASPVLIVSNLDPEKVSTEHLFTLFGVYGDVIRVKILHNKRDTALIQFVNPQQAETALTHLNCCPLYGNTLRVNFSKHSTISLPRPGTEQEGSHLTKDYSGSSLHRFKVVGSRNYIHICPLSAVLHLSNLPENITDATVRELFSQSGTVVAFRFFPKEKKMGLIQMTSVAEAVEALINMHNYLLEGINIRVSFSKTNL